MTPGVRFHVVFPPELLERVDAMLGPGQSRGDWVRRAVERALELSETSAGQPVLRERHSPAPAEQPEDHWPKAASSLEELEERESRAFSRSGAVEQASVQSPAPAPAEQLRRSSREHLPTCKCPVCS